MLPINFAYLKFKFINGSVKKIFVVKESLPPIKMKNEQNTTWLDCLRSLSNEMQTRRKWVINEQNMQTLFHKA